MKMRLKLKMKLKLSQDASKLSSLLYFKPAFYSLSRPHPIWSSAGSNPYEVEKACCQARMLSGRYRTCWLARYWSGDKSDSCSLPNCSLDPTPGTHPHILVECIDLVPARQRVIELWSTYLRDKPELLQVIKCYTVEEKSSQFPQLLLDCTVLPEVITLVQQHGSSVHDSLLYLTKLIVSLFTRLGLSSLENGITSKYKTTKFYLVSEKVTLKTEN